MRVKLHPLCDVYDLSFKDSEIIKLDRDIVHHRKGPYVRGQRFFRLSSLRVARDTHHLHRLLVTERSASSADAARFPAAGSGPPWAFRKVNG